MGKGQDKQRSRVDLPPSLRTFLDHCASSLEMPVAELAAMSVAIGVKVLLQERASANLSPERVDVFAELTEVGDAIVSPRGMRRFQAIEDLEWYIDAWEALKANAGVEVDGKVARPLSEAARAARAGVIDEGRVELAAARGDSLPF